MDLEFLNPAIERKKKFRNAIKIIKEKYKEIKRILPDAELYIFGSYAENTYDVLSDIDIAVVSDRFTDKHLIELQKLLGSPFEIHLFSKKEWENFGKKIKYIKIEDF